jgi:EAL domain-containing protein (putative c-di-GMP-specific phosphodiesterase class I)
VLRQACAEAARWPQPLRVAVNLSPVQLMHADLVQVVTSALLDSGLPADRLELEVTETAFIADKARALHVLRQIKALGVSIAIDDFGTGYSSLDTLNSFPFDKIKIDRSFLLDSDTSHQARAIIRAVLALGHSLDVPVLAEGLETHTQLRLLRDEGCDEAQGFLWGRPMPMPESIPA